MLLTVLLCQIVAAADVDQPVSAVDAVANGPMAQLQQFFVEPDAETAALLAMPVARVNAQVIVAEDVLFHFTLALQKLRERIPAHEYSQNVQTIIKLQLPRALEQAAVFDEMSRAFPSEWIELAQQTLERKWAAEQAPELLRFLGNPEPAHSIPASLETVKKNYVRDGLMNAYLQHKFDAMKSFGKNPGENRPFDEEARRDLIDDIVKHAKIESAYSISTASK